MHRKIKSHAQSQRHSPTQPSTQLSNSNLLTNNDNNQSMGGIPVKIKAIISDNLLDDYLTGLLNTILFVRLLGSLTPSQSSFQNIIYPKIENSKNTNNTNNISKDTTLTSNLDDLLNSSPQSWVARKIQLLKKSYFDRKRYKKKLKSNHHNINNKSNNSISDVYTKIIFAVRFYSNYSGFTENAKPWESWIIDLDVLDNDEFDNDNNDNNNNNKEFYKFNINNTEIDNENENEDLLILQKQMKKLYDFIFQSPTVRLESIKSSFHSNMLEIVKLANTNNENLPSMKSHTLNPFSIKTEFLIDSKIYNNIENSISNKSSDSNISDYLDFNSFNVSSFTANDSHMTPNSKEPDSSHESIEYIHTTENGDVILSSGSNSTNDISNGNNGKRDDLWKNGYNFFKKILE